MRNLIAAMLGAVLVVATGCGDNEGSGTKTLFVSATAESDGSSNGRVMAIQVREGHSEGTLINDAVVTIRGDDSGEFNLAWEGVNIFGFRAGAYLRRELPWDRGWSIKITRGDDYLDGYLVAPGETTIAAPLGNTTFRRSEGKPLLVQWRDSMDRRAEEVVVNFDDSNDADRSFSDDPREYSVEPNRLAATSSERVTVERINRVKLAGGTPGSEFVARTYHRIDFIVE